MKVLNLLTDYVKRNRVQTFVSDIRLDFLPKKIFRNDVTPVATIFGTSVSGSFLGGRSTSSGTLATGATILTPAADGGCSLPYLVSHSFPEMEMNHVPDPSGADGIRSSVYFVFSNPIIGEQTLYEKLSTQPSALSQGMPSLHSGENVLEIGRIIGVFTRSYLPDTFTMPWVENSYYNSTYSVLMPNDTVISGKPLIPATLPVRGVDLNTPYGSGTRDAEVGWNWAFSSSQDHWFTGRIASIDAVDETITVTATNQMNSFRWPRIPDEGDWTIYPESRGERIPIIYGICKGYEVPVIRAPWSGKLARPINDSDESNIFLSPPFDGFNPEGALWIGGERVVVRSLNESTGEIELAGRGTVTGNADGARSFHSAGEQCYQEGEVYLAAGDSELDSVTALYVTANQSDKPVRIDGALYGKRTYSDEDSPIGIAYTQVSITANQLRELVGDYQRASMARQPGLKSSDTGEGLTTKDMSVWRDAGGGIRRQPIYGGDAIDRWGPKTFISASSESQGLGTYLMDWMKDWVGDTGVEGKDWGDITPESSHRSRNFILQEAPPRLENMCQYKIVNGSGEYQKYGMRYPSTASGYTWSDGAGNTTTEYDTLSEDGSSNNNRWGSGSIIVFDGFNGKNWGDIGTVAEDPDYSVFQDEYIGVGRHSLAIECSYLHSNVVEQTFAIYCFGGAIVWDGFGDVEFLGELSFTNPNSGDDSATFTPETKTITWANSPLFGKRISDAFWYLENEKLKGESYTAFLRNAYRPNYFIVPKNTILFSNSDPNEAWEINLVTESGKTTHEAMGKGIALDLEYQSASAPSIVGSEVTELAHTTSVTGRKFWPWGGSQVNSFPRKPGVPVSGPYGNYKEWRNATSLATFDTNNGPTIDNFNIDILNANGPTGDQGANYGMEVLALNSGSNIVYSSSVPFEATGRLEVTGIGSMSTTATPRAITKLEVIVECTTPGTYVYDFNFVIRPHLGNNFSESGRPQSRTVRLSSLPTADIREWLDNPLGTYTYTGSEYIDVYPEGTEIGIKESSQGAGSYHFDDVYVDVDLVQPVNDSQYKEWPSGGVPYQWPRGSAPAINKNRTASSRPSFKVSMKIHYRTETSVTNEPPTSGSGDASGIPVLGAIQAHPGALGLKFYADGVGPRATKGSSTTDVVNDLQAYDDKNFGGGVSGQANDTILENPTDIIKRWIARSPGAYDFYDGPQANYYDTAGLELFNVDYSNIETSTKNLNAHYRRFTAGTNTAETVEWGPAQYKFGFDARTLGSDWESVLSRLAFECRTNLVRTTGSGKTSEKEMGMPFRFLAAGLDSAGTSSWDSSSRYFWPAVTTSITIDEIYSFNITQKDVSEIANDLNVYYDPDLTIQSSKTDEDIKNFKRVSSTNEFGTTLVELDFGSGFGGKAADLTSTSQCTVSDETTDWSGVGAAGDTSVLRVTQTGSAPTISFNPGSFNGSHILNQITFRMRRAVADDGDGFGDFRGSLNFKSEDYPSGFTHSIYYSDYYGVDPSQGNIGAFYMTFDLESPPASQTSGHEWSTFKTAIQDETDIITEFTLTLDSSFVGDASVWDLFSFTVHSENSTSIVSSREDHGIVVRNEYLMALRNKEAAEDLRMYLEGEYSRKVNVVRAVVERRKGMEIELGDIVNIAVPRDSRDETVTAASSTKNIRVIGWGLDDTGCQIVGVEI